MTDMSPAFMLYRDLEKQLLALRTKTDGKYCAGEPAITDRMVEVWDEMSDEEQDLIYSEGAKVPLPSDAPSQARNPGIGNLWAWHSSRTTWEVQVFSRPRVGEYFADQVVSRGLERWFDPISSDALKVREAVCT